MNKLTKYALNRPVSTALIILAILVFGLTSVFGFRLELTPDMEMPMLLVIDVYPGADPQTVEKLVTKEIEAAGSELSGISSYTSQSSENSAMVMFQYDYDVDIDDAYMDLRTALDGLGGTLPEDAQEPFIVEMSMNAMDTLTLSATAVGDVDILTYVEKTLKPELETLIGVADVNVSGGRENYIKVELNEESMKRYGLSMANIKQYMQALDFNMPGGIVTHGSQEVTVSSSADIVGVPQIRDIPIPTSTGSLISLGDVAEVTYSLKDADSISRYNGNENITIGVSKKQSQGTVNVASEVVKVVERLNAENKEVELSVVYNASDDIIASLTSVGQTLALGVVLSMIILFLFFGDIRASLIVGSSMPVSLFVTMILMNAMGFSFNVVTTGALVIAIGMMVDSSIVVIESCFRLKDEEADFKTAALKGTKIVAGSIIASTITTVVVYLPLSMMSGLSGQMFSQLGYTIIFAMLASLIVALTLIPLLFTKMRPIEKKQLLINKVLAVINKGYDKILRKILYKKLIVVLFSILLLGLSVFMAKETNMELMPSTDEGMIAVNVSFRSGTKLDIIDQQIRPIEEIVAGNKSVERYNITISGNKATITGYLKEDVRTASMVEYFSKEFANVTNMDISVAAGGASMGSMMSSNLEVDLNSYDLVALKEASKVVEDMIRQVPGVLKISSSISEASTKAQVIVDPLKAMSVGLTPVSVAANINQILSGTEALKITRDGEEVSVFLEYPPGQYEDINSLMNLSLTTQRGSQIPLSDVASVEYTDAPETLTKVDGVYMASITAATTETSKFTVPKIVSEKMKTLTLPSGVSQIQSNMQEMMEEEFKALFIAIFTSVFLVFLVMAMQFESPRFSGMVMLSIPFSLIGSFFLLFISDTTLSMVSLMGILMLVGIVVNNGILYVDTVNYLRQDMFVEEALIQSGQLRLRPILMTTLTTILSMVPMAVATGGSSAMMKGMAFVIIGGLVASTLLILLLLPTFYLIIYEGKGKRLKKKKDKKNKEITAAS